MIDLRFVPLELALFPGGARKTRRNSTVFKSTYTKTLDRLEDELRHLKAADILIQAGFGRADIRNDGWPRVGIRASHPAVVLSFRSAKRDYSFPCDTFTTFEHNLHAIAFTLEALRAVNRYGVTRGHEQYTGFAQIEAPKKWTVDDAAHFLAVKIGATAQEVVEDAEDYRRLYRQAAAVLHPDRGGNPHDWKLLCEAKALLDKHHGLTVDTSAAEYIARGSEK